VRIHAGASEVVIREGHSRTAERKRRTRFNSKPLILGTNT
jgi:hypothetical protein